MRPPTESEARAALAAKYPEFADQPVWFDGRVPTEEGFVVDREKREWSYYSRSWGLETSWRQGRLEWNDGGWRTADEFQWLCHGYPEPKPPRLETQQPPRQEPDLSDDIPAPREVRE